MKQTAAHAGKYPIRFLSRVYHVGTLNAADKGARGPSLEGHGLSISTHPEAWIKIARLGGLPVWHLIKKGGAFLDFHSMGKSHRRRIEEWAIAQGLAHVAGGFEVSWYDDELERRCKMVFLDKTHATSECEGVDGREIQAISVIAATAKLESRVGLRVDPTQTLDMAAVCFASDVLLTDGVFWKDDLDVPGYSAPRGMILPERLREWDIKPAVRDLKLG